MRIAGLSACLCVSLSAVFAQSNTSKPLGTVPFELVDNRITVGVTLNGQGPFRMILDTGGTLFVSPEVARKIGAKPESERTVEGVGEKTTVARVGQVRELTLGPIRLVNVPFETFAMDDIQPVFGNVSIDGILGHEIFTNYVVRHDYERHELSFYDPKSFVYSGSGESIPLEFAGTLPVIQATLDGITSKFVVDTGARSALILFGPFIRENHLGQKYRPRFQGISGWGVGGPVRSYMVRTKSLRFGNFELSGLVARLSLNKAGSTATQTYAGLIGPDVLKRFVFICDYARNRLIFEKNNSFGQQDSYDRAGIWISQKGDAFEVVDVIAGGPADRAGLKIGDIVLSVDGKPAADLILPTVRDAWKYGKPGTVVRLQVQSVSGVKRQAEFALEDLV